MSDFKLPVTWRTPDDLDATIAELIRHGKKREKELERYRQERGYLPPALPQSGPAVATRRNGKPITHDGETYPTRKALAQHLALQLNASVTTIAQRLGSNRGNVAAVIARYRPGRKQAARVVIPQPALDEATIAEVFRLIAEGQLTYRIIGQRFGTSKSTIGGLVYRRKAQNALPERRPAFSMARARGVGQARPLPPRGTDAKPAEIMPENIPGPATAPEAPAAAVPPSASTHASGGPETFAPRVAQSGLADIKQLLHLDRPPDRRRGRAPRRRRHDPAQARA